MAILSLLFSLYPEMIIHLIVITVGKQTDQVKYLPGESKKKTWGVWRTVASHLVTRLLGTKFLRAAESLN